MSLNWNFRFPADVQNGSEDEDVITAIMVLPIKLKRDGRVRGDVVTDFHKSSLKIVAEARSQREGSIT